MAVTMEPNQPASVWDAALELTKIAQLKNENPTTWAVHLSSYLRTASVDVPSPDLAHILVRHICFENHIPITWKLLDKSISCNLAPPLLVLALLSSRVLPNRRIHPSAYRLYLELLQRHVFSSSLPSQPHYSKIMKAIDESMGLSSVFDLQHREPGILFAVFLFSTTWQLLDASLDDENLLQHTSDMGSLWLTETTEAIQISSSEAHEKLIKANTVMAIEIIVGLLTNRTTSSIIHLSRRNLPSHWGKFKQGAQLLASQSSALNNVKGINRETLIHLISENQTLSASKMGDSLCPLVSPSTQRLGSSSSLWIPIDIFLEDVMDGSQVTVSGAIKRLIGILRALQSINNTSWHDAFLGLWIAALRLVQREREPSEGPMPRIDISMCMLLSIATLAVAGIVEDEQSDETTQRKAHLGLITCLQQLGEFENLLTPPHSVASLANQAASKAIMVVSGLPHDPQSNHFSMDGNLRHLIVESCIGRNLLDTSAYYLPGYVKTRPNPVPRSVAPPNAWSLLMKGSPLTPSLANALITCPASSVSEVQKIYEIAVDGSDEEKIFAGSILCGASLVRGWSIQEYTLLFIINLLSPPIPADYVGEESHLVIHAPLLNVLVIGISTPECVQMYTLHGLVPILATALLPICEVFGSLNYRTWTLLNGEELTSHAFFSNAFTLLLRLWRFDKAPLEHVTDDVPPVGTQLSPVFLMLVRNRQLAKTRGRMKKCAALLHVDTSPVSIDSFPQLKQWYRQHVECIESAVPGLVRGMPVHQIVDALLTMMFRKINRAYAAAPAPAPSSSSSSSGTFPDDTYPRLKIPAWDILEACPIALDAALTACSLGKLFPRELATGLKDLADFLPASLAAIVSYFSAEVTRGVWKPVPMNGTDWPSPAANLATVEEQIKNILAATGVDVPSLSLGGTPQLTLPLPLAAFVSLTITYKLEKTSHRFLVLIGPYLKALAASCPWPCLPIVSALWIQKVKRWNDFFIFSASRTVFHHNNDAVAQLLESCFASALGFNSPGGAGGLLGHGISPPVAPGFLYLRVHRAVRNTMFLTNEILSVLMQTVRRIAGGGEPGEAARVKKGFRYREASYSTALEKVKVAAAVGASLVWIGGGLALVQSLLKEILPSWFISGSGGAEEGGGAVARLGGYAVAYMAVLCGAFTWGINSASPAARRRGTALQGHMEFVACVLEGKIAMGCHVAMTEAYVVGFLSLVVGSAPAWIAEVDAGLLWRLSIGLRRWNEDDLALHLLCLGGTPTMSFATELILQTE